MAEPRTTLTWLGTAGWLLRHGRTVVVTDPFLSRPAGARPFPLPGAALAEADLLLCSHGHFDHAMDLAAVALRSRAAVWAPRVVLPRLRQAGVAAERLHANEGAAEARIGDVGLRVVPSRHIRYDLLLGLETVAAMVRGGTLREILGLGLLWPLGSNSDFLLDLGGRTLFLSGSLGLDARTAAEIHPDVALLPYNGRSDLPARVAEACGLLRPRHLILHHHDVFFPHFAPAQDPARALPLLARRFPALRVHVPEPGVAIDLAGW